MYLRRFLVGGIVAAAIVFPPTLLWGNPRSGSPGSDDGGARRCFPSWGHRFLEHVLAGGVLRWSGVVFRVEVGESRRRGVAGSQ